MNVKVYNQSGKESGSLALSDEVFGAEFNETLIHEVVVAQMANKRQGTKSTLTRTEVRGGGKKPYRQKGTGRARQGSTRAPQWIKGGVVFAPKPRDFTKKINKQAKRTAFKSAISAKVRDNEVIVLDAIKLKETKTKEVANILEKLKLDRSVLLVLPAGLDNVVLAARNIPFVTTVAADLVSVYDLVSHQKCVLLKDAAVKIEEAYKE